jgi:hypothetical protein
VASINPLDSLRHVDVMAAFTVAAQLRISSDLYRGEHFNGTGSEVMRRIAAPMVGGMITAPLLSMFVIPALYLLIRRPRAREESATARLSEQPSA